MTNFDRFTVDELEKLRDGLTEIATTLGVDPEKVWQSLNQELNRRPARFLKLVPEQPQLPGFES